MPSDDRSALLLPRPRLINSLLAALPGRATLVVAPAGYGKSSLLRQLEAATDIPFIHLAFTPDDVTLDRFVRRVVAGIREELSGGNGSHFREAGDVTIETLTAELSELAELSKESYCILALDDYHYPSASPAVNELLGRILADLPAELHLLLASRTLPEIRELPRLQAEHQMASLGPRELAFTIDELKDLLRQTTSIPAEDEDAKELLRITRGWPACAALLAAQGIPLGATVPDASNVYSYFAAEVLRGLPARLARFMLKTSVLPFLSSGACDRLLARKDSSRFIHALLERRLLQPSASQPDALEYHPLLREFLTSRLRSQSPAGHKEMTLRAAEVCRERELWAEAVALLSSLEAWDRLADLLGIIGKRLLAEGQLADLSRWLDRLPHQKLAERQDLSLLRCSVAYQQGNASTALQILSTGDQAPANPEALVIEAACLCMLGQHMAAVRTARHAIRVARALGDRHSLAYAGFHMGKAYGVLGSYRAAERAFRFALRHFIAAGDTRGEAECYSDLVGICQFQGRTDEEIAFLENARRLWRRLGNATQLSRTLNNLGVSYQRRGHIVAAKKAFLECLGLAGKANARNLEGYSLIGLAELLRDEGRLQQAGSLYDRALAIADEVEDRTLHVFILAGCAELKRIEGELHEAEILAKQALLESQAHENDHEIATCLVVLGATMSDAGKTSEAISSLRKAAELFEGSRSLAEAAVARFTLASALFRIRLRAKALVSLNQAAQLTQEMGHDRFLFRLMVRSVALLEYAVTKGRREPFVGWLGEVKRTSGTDTRETGTVISVFVLGHFSVEVNGSIVSDLAWETTKAKEIFLYLLTRRRPATKEEIGAAMWPDLSPSKLDGYFHSNLHRIRRVIGAKAIARRGRAYLLDEREFSLKVDMFEFFDRVRAAEHGSADDDALGAAISLYRGAFAPELYSEWALQLRAYLEGQYVWALNKLLTRTLNRGEREEASRLCQRLLEVDPFHETAWKELIQYYRDSGLLGLSLRTYRRCMDAYLRELGAPVPQSVMRAVQAS